MTITVAPARNEYTASGGQTAFNFTFKIFSVTDLNVYITPAGQDANDSTDLTTSYTVDPSGINNEDGGFITLSSGVGSGDLVTIVSNVPSSRTIDYQNNGDFRPETVNADFDRVVSIAKKIEDTANRTVLLQQSQQDPKPLDLPAPKAGQIIRWKGDESGFENFEFIPSSGIANGDIFVFPNVGAMKASISENIKVGANIVTQGYYNAGDGGGASYIVEASQAVDNWGNHDLSTGNVALIQDNLKASSWGAIGNNIDDDSDALNALIDFANGRLISLDKKEYKADLSPTVTKLNIKSIVDGTIIYPSVQTSLENFTYVRMMEIGFDGTNQPNGTAPCFQFLNSSNIKVTDGEWRNTKRGILSLNTCENAIIRGCYLHDSGQEEASPGGVNQGDAIDVYNSSDVTVEENRIEDIWQIAVFVFNDGVGGESTDITIRTNYCKNIQDNGIRCQPADAAFDGIRNVTIEDNFLDTVTIDGIRANGQQIKVRNNKIVNASGLAVKTEGGDDITIRDNIIRGCGRGIGIRQLDTTQAVINWRVNGNNIDSCGVDGISVTRVSGTFAIEKISITDNIITNMPQKGISVVGTNGTDIINCLISNNILQAVQDQGILLAWIGGLNVSDNLVKNTNQSINTSAGAIDLLDCDDFVIKGNIVTDSSAINMWAITIDGNSDHGQVVFNDVRGATGSTGINKASSGTDILYGQNINKTFVGESVYTFTNLASLKTIDTATATATQVANMLGTFLEDVEAGRYFRRD